MKRFIHPFSGGMVLILLMGSMIYAQDMSFSDWDKDGNGIVTRSEFYEVFKKIYAADLNAVDDAHLDDEDFFTISYEFWDLDDDELLTEEEWLYGHDYAYGEYIPEDFDAVDIDGDGYIEFTEYFEAPFEKEYYVVWDVDEDEFISENELARMVFNNWDIDDSNFIEEDEYEQFDEYYLDI